MMANVNLESWASQPDVCRCCLAASGSWDMLAAYINEAGSTEVYSEILHSCFGISLSSLSEWGPGRLVCDQCVDRLRNAYTFKKQVVKAEETFVLYINSREDVIEETESLDVKGSISIQDEGTETSETDKNNEKLSNTTDWMCTREVQKVNLKSNAITKKVNCIENSSPSEGCPDFEVNVDVSSITVDATNTAFQSRPTKQVSERKRIKTTCESVLQATTACPFRHHRSWFQCFFCTQSFMELSALKLHTVQTHDDTDGEVRKLKRYPRSLQIDITELRCRKCGLDLGDVEGMRTHLKDKHGLVVYKECIADYKVDRSPYTCHLCQKQFHVFRTLTTHLNEHYANCICAVCGRAFLNARRLEVHARTHQRGTFPCNRCGKVLTTKSSQANHMETHSKRIIRCQICSEPMKHYNSRIKHMSEVHNITHSFKCHICDREYNIKHYLATHIRQTHGHKDKKCGECGMMFVTNHGLKKHMQKHSGVKAFSCDICSKAYARSCSLKDHMRVHEITASLIA